MASLTSHTTTSSSGIRDCDVTVLGHEKDATLVRNIEKQLCKKGYTVSCPLVAGRSIEENLISRVKHAKITIILFKDKTAKQFQSFLETLPPKPYPGSLDVARTLIICKDGVKYIKRAYKNIVRLKLAFDASKIVDHVCRFIEAFNTAEIKGISDPLTLREFYVDLLLHMVINPRCRTTLPHTISIKMMEKFFENRYGSFRHMLVGVTDLKQYIEKRNGFQLKIDENDEYIVEQTKIGSSISSEWLSRVKTKDRTTKECESRRSEEANSRVNPPLRRLPSENVKIEEATHSRAMDWVSTVETFIGHVEKNYVNWEKSESLRKCLYEFDSRYSFFLITGKSTPPDDHQGIIKIPWLKVFDFNTNSRKNGLLSSAEIFLENYTISTHKDPYRPLFNKKVDWYFPLGFSNKADTITEERGCMKWFSSVKSVLEEQCSAIANFCIARTMPVFVILWYDKDEKSIKYLDKFLSVLFPAVNSETLQKRVILCCSGDPEENNSLNSLAEECELRETTIRISPNDVFKYFAQADVPERSSHNFIKLPKAKDEEADLEIVDIPKESVWINDYIEVLSLESQAEITQRSTKTLGLDFVKGSTVTWDELSAGIAVQREIKRKLSKYLTQDVIKNQKSMIIKIFHAPGGGGTTFARQLLWDLHFKVPCGVVVPNLTLSVTHLTDSIRFLYDHTRLPIVLLVDGRSNYEVEQIYENNKYAVVILHVQRYNNDIPKAKFNSNLRTCHLPGSVVTPEAQKLTEIFSKFSPKSADALATLNCTSDINENKIMRYIFEYGLTAFDHEFKGVRKYVHGYLKIEPHTERIKNLHNWQKVVSYLALVLYYGQNGLHRETFHDLLKGEIHNEFVTLEDMPFSGSQFILESPQQEWKISYNVVAKEILEQILSSSTDLCVSGNMELSKAALKNLHELVIDFILMTKRIVREKHPENILQILEKMFLNRDYIDTNTDAGNNKRCMLSKLLEQIPVKENRVKILRQLTYAFPKHTEFHAHLGRLLNILGKYDEAEKSLQKALDIRKKERAGADPRQSDDVLGRIHHMFGFGYLLQAQGEMKQLFPKQKTNANEETRKSSPNELRAYVDKAIYHFSLVRRKTTHNLSYGYIGEVRSRLLMVEYVDKKFVNGCRTAFEDQTGRENVSLFEFVRDSHSVCDQLLAECRQYNADVELRRLQDYTKCVNIFNRCFSEIKGNMPLWDRAETNIYFRRSQIASLKMHFIRGESKHLPGIETINNKDDLSKIISLHEKTLQETFSGNLDYVSISQDATEWLEAIRHRLAADKYSLVKVLDTVSDWDRRKEVGLATFYLYVINFVLAIISPGQDISEGYNNRAEELKEKMLHEAKKNQYRTFWKLEWLAKHNGQSIKRLINKNKLGVWDKDKRFWKEEEHVQKLQVCTGTVIRSSQPLFGSISVDVPFPNRKNRVEVYFVPKLYGLWGARFADSSVRVEFFIGFSPKHGAQAFQIKRLERNSCPNCKEATETLTISGGETLTCAICRRVFKLELKPISLLAENQSNDDPLRTYSLKFLPDQRKLKKKRARGGRKTL